MHCLIFNSFNQKTPEKLVNRMSLVVLDFECIENNIVNENHGIDLDIHVIDLF